MPDIVEHQPISNVAPAAQHIEPNPHMDVVAANVDTVHEKEIEKELAKVAKEVGGEPTHTAALAQDLTGDNIQIIEKPKVHPDDNRWGAERLEEIENLKKGIKVNKKNNILSGLTSIFSRKNSATKMQDQQISRPQQTEGEIKNAA
ncbi:MAG TPA: hypothetical protein VG917_04585 [Patescibacteria group bacterium]|nr:hypothetical protein [Patescibacteria group bacterium]